MAATASDSLAPSARIRIARLGVLREFLDDVAIDSGAGSVKPIADTRIPVVMHAA